jgi:hypothetical protein
MSVCPQVIDDKSYRRLIFNECVNREFRSLLEDETWVGVFLGIVFAVLITIGVARSGGSFTANLPWIALVWGSFVGVPLLFIYGVAVYGCYPLLRFRSQEECEDVCTSRYSDCNRRCYGKEGEEWWECDSSCDQSNSDCLNRCREAFYHMCRF